MAKRITIELTERETYALRDLLGDPHDTGNDFLITQGQDEQDARALRRIAYKLQGAGY